MEIIKVLAKRPDQRVIKKAAQIIRRGGLVIFPTETVYGLGADAFNSRAVRKIFKVKGRPEKKPLIVHVSKKSTIDALAKDVPLVARVLAKKFWPGPLTLVLKRKKIVPDEVTGGGDTVAMRMPAHKVALALIRVAGPIAASSANFSDEKPSTRISEIPRALLKKVDLVIDAGSTPVKVPSTVLDLTKTTPPKILRTGAVSRKQLEVAGLDFSARI
ncbi:threonylcarbamoyl-AMP synthase [Candidatus Uhrbacteria bacterium RIFCSPLOWO2_01_FULL_47_24]|uniref:L-threonylcarbamoyladenylate synthase n=1 Tax=Candidatus Uhrbacteria bacterium RIFCSPLOWO2_01_FULL_47_24 TaxID=1802401 RepID=A0A1F7UNS9_9BACT|nr:MAG: threonylcarbamoyl-AMP synthase [Candidatus Uhrbacteria bacterium RIFCSPHIGHO2_02_FULL_46_47]OGL76715.1 MAG: threonylcarbamoyl-AMP synthase [Candidatus Uhrbacteria bacterium RIFCSPHIGHO2_12_FULL_47_11]OGL79941.1 MAG: threonylcarbamoyl-AMP synthase [Candidatus Uhrbacteria bacterium RIFCSPLOWO2_01_FULL_47_24]OGL84198.1 MAG: threonylcarbamoyl-AMP synthase [Candidatus Uhrbacteria bacterium RIFCSPLOWO2_02_FULL_46_25]OGL93348.1 MAG: threonylcarbamoyl-AMP synthase [Candidatus Uhrbacteria bacter